MNCKNCNSPISEGEVFCSNCGQRIVEDTIKTEESVNNNGVINNVEPQVFRSEPVINSEPVSKKGSNTALLIVLIVIGGLLLLGGIAFVLFRFVIPSSDNGSKNKQNPIVEPTKPTKKNETITSNGYTFTIPSGYTVKDYNGSNIIGNNKFKFQIVGVDTFYSYSDYSSEDVTEVVKEYIPEETAKFLKQTEETYSGKKFLIYSFNRNNKYADAVLTELSDGNVLMLMITYEKESSKEKGYTDLAEFVSSATKETSTVEPTPDYDEDYMVMGDDNLGYLKLPGTWIKASVVGASDSSLQYLQYDGGKYIVTLDILDKTQKEYADVKTCADALVRSYNNDSDSSNVRSELTKLGKYDAYKVYIKYKSDNVWVISWVFMADDGKIHLIQVEGLDTSHKNFNIPNTFSLTKIN